MLCCGAAEPMDLHPLQCNSLERDLLFLLGFRLHVRREEYDALAVVLGAPLPEAAEPPQLCASICADGCYREDGALVASGRAPRDEPERAGGELGAMERGRGCSRDILHIPGCILRCYV